MKPTIGRIVHYVRYGLHCPAIITGVAESGQIHLVYFDQNDQRTEYEWHVRQDEQDKHHGTWHFPERVQE